MKNLELGFKVVELKMNESTLKSFSPYKENNRMSDKKEYGYVATFTGIAVSVQQELKDGEIEVTYENGLTGKVDIC